MSDSLAVAKEDFGGVLELLVGLKKGRDFPKRKQARYVRELDRGDLMDSFKQCQIRPLKGYNDCNHEVCRWNISDVCSTQYIEVHGEGLQTNASG